MLNNSNNKMTWQRDTISDVFLGILFIHSKTETSSCKRKRHCVALQESQRNENWFTDVDWRLARRANPVTRTVARTRQQRWSQEQSQATAQIGEDSPHPERNLVRQQRDFDAMLQEMRESCVGIEQTAAVAAILECAPPCRRPVKARKKRGIWNAWRSYGRRSSRANWWAASPKNIVGRWRT